MATVVVAGAGVVGLSVARAVARRGLQVFVLEKNAHVGMETSSRNSEVLHAGLYYKHDSWKAKLCVEGKQMLTAFCDEFGVPYNTCGKLIVAQAHQAEQLREIASRGVANGVADLKLITRSDARALEPHVECDQALFSPSTGVIDSHGLMLALQGDAEKHGTSIAFCSSAKSAVYNPHSRTVHVTGTTSSRDGGVAGEQFEIECDYFVNASGLFAPLLLPPQLQDIAPTMPARFAKGTYFRLRDNARPFSHLVYPIPEIGGLGVHSTVDLDGNVRFGPDVEWVDHVDYTPNQSKAAIFADRIQSYWPDVAADNLVADYCGVRPKISKSDSIYEDFYIAGEETHGIPQTVHLCGIESPGLTSALAIGEVVAELLNGKSS